jgi:hypothetical protein
MTPSLYGFTAQRFPCALLLALHCYQADRVQGRLHVYVLVVSATCTVMLRFSEGVL